MDSKKLVDFLDNFLSIFQRKYDTTEQWSKALCKLFCQLIRPSELPSRINIDGIFDFDDLQEQFRTKVIQYKISQQMSEKSATSVANEKTEL